MPVQLEHGSFRDRNARVFYRDGAVYRYLNREALDNWHSVSVKPFYLRFTTEHKIIPTTLSDLPQPALEPFAPHWVGVLRHDTIPFISYPYEWCFGMLQDAALLQLDLLSTALQDDVSLKDASPFNFQWFGSQPIFIDTPSLVPWKPGEPWLGYRQFCELFLYPLFLRAYKDVPFQPLLRGMIEGLVAENVAPLFSIFDVWKPGILTHLFLHSRIRRREATSRRSIRQDLIRLGFSKEIILSNIKGLRSVIEHLIWTRSESPWSDYAKRCPYSSEDYETKKLFVRAVVEERDRGLGWDLGCNDGAFSEILAARTETVVAMDSDARVVENLYRRLKAGGNRRILPLVMNLADPSPNLGWRGRERKTLRQRGHPNLLLALALVHHLTISNNIPLDEIVCWLAEMGEALIVEFIPLTDPMVQRLLLNKDGRHEDYSQENFERLLALHFSVRRRLRLKSGRYLYYGEVLKNGPAREDGDRP